MFKGLSRQSSVIEVTKTILDEIYWLGELIEAYPGRFHYYFEHEISEEMLVALANFLRLSPDKTWLANALSVMKTKPSYEHDSELSTFYRNYVTQKFGRFPALSEGLLLFS